MEYSFFKVPDSREYFVARFISLLLACALAACSGSKDESRITIRDTPYRYLPTAEMSSMRAQTAEEDVGVLIPVGWKETIDQLNAPNIILWLVREDYAASISFTSLNMDPALYAALKKDGEIAIAKVSLGLKKNRATDSVQIVQQPESFTLRGRRCAAYEYSIDRGLTVIRVVVFDTGTRFLDCALLPTSSTITPADNRQLFETQQSVLASMVIH